jgi:DNA repair exonuclease SbcCD ATPase subunit
MININIENLQNRLHKLEGVYQSLKSQENILIKEIENIKNELDIYTKVSTVIKHLLDTLVVDEINKIAGLVTYGLKAVFDDQDLSFKPVIIKKNDRIYIEFKTVHNGHDLDFGFYGGSVAVLESFLLRIICILKMNLAKLIMLDEGLVAIGTSEYVHNASKLINELADRIGLDVLLVTHQPEFKKYANKIYRVEDTINGLMIKPEQT